MKKNVFWGTKDKKKRIVRESKEKYTINSQEEGLRGGRGGKSDIAPCTEAS